MSLAEIMAEERRAAILATLAEMPAYKLNENTLKMALDGLGHRITRDQQRGLLSWLADQGLARIVREPVEDGELWIAILTASGQDVAGGAAHPGIARPRAH